jgi:molybdopterin-guanine dinucleotide biosynthesis protein A
MKTNKALHRHQGMPMWRFQMEKLNSLHPNQLFFSIPRAMKFPSGPWTFLHDRLPEMGPLGGLQAALHGARSEFLMSLAVDMPGMTSEFLSEMLAESETAGVVPLFEGFYCGAAAVYPIKILPLVEKILAGRDRSFQCLLRAAIESGLMKTKEISDAQRSLFENWNAPEDLGRNESAPAS